jgi:hypothetical protein
MESTSSFGHTGHFEPIQFTERLQANHALLYSGCQLYVSSCSSLALPLSADSRYLNIENSDNPMIVVARFDKRGAMLKIPEPFDIQGLKLDRRCPKEGCSLWDDQIEWFSELQDLIIEQRERLVFNTFAAKEDWAMEG